MRISSRERILPNCLTRIKAPGDGLADWPEDDEHRGGDGASEASRGEAEDRLQREEQADELADDLFRGADLLHRRRDADHFLAASAGVTAGIRRRAQA